MSTGFGTYRPTVVDKSQDRDKSAVERSVAEQVNAETRERQSEDQALSARISAIENDQLALIIALG